MYAYFLTLGTTTELLPFFFIFSFLPLSLFPHSLSIPPHLFLSFLFTSLFQFKYLLAYPVRIKSSVITVCHYCVLKLIALDLNPSFKKIICNRTEIEWKFYIDQRLQKINNYQT